MWRLPIFQRPATDERRSRSRRQMWASGRPVVPRTYEALPECGGGGVVGVAETDAREWAWRMWTMAETVGRDGVMVANCDDGRVGDDAVDDVGGLPADVCWRTPVMADDGRDAGASDANEPEVVALVRSTIVWVAAMSV